MLHLWFGGRGKSLDSCSNIPFVQPRNTELSGSCSCCWRFGTFPGKRRGCKSEGLTQPMELWHGMAAAPGIYQHRDSRAGPGFSPHPAGKGTGRLENAGNTPGMDKQWPWGTSQGINWMPWAGKGWTVQETPGKVSSSQSWASHRSVESLGWKGH